MSSGTKPLRVDTVSYRAGQTCWTDSDPPYAPRGGGIRWRRFIFGAIIIWLLLLMPNGIDVYQHRNDPPDDLFPVSPLATFEMGSALMTVAYVLVLAVVVAAIKFFHGRHGQSRGGAPPGAPDKPGG